MVPIARFDAINFWDAQHMCAMYPNEVDCQRCWFPLASFGRFCIFCGLLKTIKTDEHDKIIRLKIASQLIIMSMNIEIEFQSQTLNPTAAHWIPLLCCLRALYRFERLTDLNMLQICIYYWYCVPFIIECTFYYTNKRNQTEQSLWISSGLRLKSANHSLHYCKISISFDFILSTQFLF